MRFAAAQWAALVGHHATHSDAMRGIDVRVDTQQPGTLALQYVLRAEMPRIRIPPSQPAGRADGLWRHTCFEAFIAAAGMPGYYELNFSPSRQWAIYRFDAYRDGMSPIDVATPPELAVRRFDDRLELDALIRLPDPTALQGARSPKLALSAVVEDDSGTLSYWALQHTPGKPDFHHPDGFVLELPT
ncbi:MAG: DOMON-like domain-containing protein [Steroidobacteraceae bacterium]